MDKEALLDGDGFHVLLLVTVILEVMVLMLVIQVVL